MFENFRKSLSQFIAPVKNASTRLGNQFLRFGSGRALTPTWKDIIIADQDLYTGYGYATIRNRASAVARTAKEYVRTDSDKEDFVHPYLETISSSKTFSDYKFWNDISTYLDLEGVYYLMAVRAVGENKLGNVQEFKLLNPYQITRILDADQLKVGGYIENRNGNTREIDPKMIIEIRELNPFDNDTPYALADAAKESTFTLKTSGDFTRNALRNNINAPGILSTDVLLKPEEFKNFTDRVRNHTKGEPIFGNGAGAISYTSMNVELSKADLNTVNEGSRQELFAAAGMSKTMLGIEQSGTTRDTAEVQKELNMDGQILPRITLIIDALNQDYKNYYPADDAKNKATICVDNPQGTDHDAETKKVAVEDSKFTLFQKMVDGGYTKEDSAGYVEGKIDLEDLSDPIMPDPVVDEPVTEDVTPPAEPVNSVSTSNAALIGQHEGQLKNQIVNIDEQIVASAIKRIKAPLTNAFNKESDVVSKKEKNNAIDELIKVLGGFYAMTFLLKGQEVMRDRVGKFALKGKYTIDNASRKYIKNISKKVANSHIDTISTEIYKSAQEAALAGLSQDQIVAQLQTQYSATVVDGRAKAVARTETNRAFTRAQFEADTQFIDQNDLRHRAFKQWHTRSDNPCPFCQSLEDEGPIPFDDAFRDLGDDITVGDKVLPVNFETLEAGNAHPNCSCDYELIIESENSIKKKGIAELQVEKAKAEKQEVNSMIDELDKVL